jgi:hypothetical protein
MRKILSIACVALAVAALASCKKTYVSNYAPAQAWVTNPAITPSQWSQTTDGKADSVDIPVRSNYDFFRSSTDATLVYFSFSQGVWEQIPEVYNGLSYSYFHYQDQNNVLHVVLYSQPVNGGTPVKPVDNITVKLVTIPAEKGN